MPLKKDRKNCQLLVLWYLSVFLTNNEDSICCLWGKISLHKQLCGAAQELYML